MKEVPKYYDNLDLTLEEILGLIQRGVKDRKSGFHNFVLATSSFKNEPDARTVVLRGFDSEKMEISFHSDLRSQKINQLIKNKNVCLVFYDEKKKIQLRIKTKSFILRDNAEIRKYWDKVPLTSRKSYSTKLAPSSAIDNKNNSNTSPNRRHSSPGKLNHKAFKGHTMSQISNAKMAAKKLKHRQKQRRAKKAMVKRSISTPG